MVIWFLGKSASGKTFFGEKLYNALRVNYPNIVFLDGDLLRNAISKDLGHSKEDRYISKYPFIFFLFHSRMLGSFEIPDTIT